MSNEYFQILVIKIIGYTLLVLSEL